MDKVFFFLLFGLFSISCGRSAIYPTSLPRALKPGDLVFQDLDCGDLCSAIEKVSTRKGFGPLSHVAMVEQAGPRGVVLIEALGEVRRVSFEVF
ncbi:hypothetical protein KKF84_06030, partial [Myxococcota bacterium]|nr:hypothetical protein [Myxococcota bacterium]MBU1534858.1 hypothetical protein [Myxococcota bacterium]